MKAIKKTSYGEWNALESSLRVRSALIDPLTNYRRMWISVLVQAGKDGDIEFLQSPGFDTICRMCNLCTSLTYRTLSTGIRGSYVNIDR